MTDGELARVLDDHLAAEFQHLDLDATMATMTADPYLNHVPVMTGGIGRDEVREFYGGAGGRVSRRKFHLRHRRR